MITGYGEANVGITENSRLYDTTTDQYRMTTAGILEACNKSLSNLVPGGWRDSGMCMTHC